MVGLGEILRRFRFHGVPGAPLAVGVPGDRTSEIARELAPVFSALEEPQRRARAMVEEAERHAARRRAEAAVHADRLLAEARAGAPAARAQVVTDRLAGAEDRSRRELAAGKAEADRVDRVVAERLPAMVDEVVRRALSLVALDGQQASREPAG